MATHGEGIDLASLFQSVTGQLQNKKTELNKADQYNHDHGDNMVDTFSLITQAMKEKPGASPADQLAYASQILKQKQSGSSQLYANGLAQAAEQFKGQKQITSNNAVSLIQTLLGGGKAPAKEQRQSTDSGSKLGSLFGGGKAAWAKSDSGSGEKAADKPALGRGKAAWNKPASGGGKAAWDKPAFGGKAAWEKPAFGGKAAWDKEPEPPPVPDKSSMASAEPSIESILAGLPPGWKATLNPETGDFRMDTPYGFEHVSPKKLQNYVKRAQQKAAETGKAGQAPAPPQSGSLRFTGRPLPNATNLDDVVNAVVADSASSSGYRQQSGSIVARAAMQAIQRSYKKE